MSTETFPTLPSGALPDSAKYKVEIDDSTMSTEIEGGYTWTRPRTTRRNRRSWTIGYTDLPDGDKPTLTDFFEVVGKSVIFSWVNPEDGVTYQVRFSSPISFDYKGVLNYRKWDCSFNLKEA